MSENIEDFTLKLPANDFQLKERIEQAVHVLLSYGPIDGAHHKEWVIDQTIRHLTGPEYGNFVKWYEQDGEWEWPLGIAP